MFGTKGLFFLPRFHPHFLSNMAGSLTKKLSINNLCLQLRLLIGAGVWYAPQSFINKIIGWLLYFVKLS